MSGGGIAGILMIFLLVIVLFIAASCVKIVPQASASVYRARGNPRELKRAGGGFPAAAGHYKR